MSEPKRFVYILKSVSDPTQYYVGVTSNPFARLAAHNAGLSVHTAEHRPWKTLVVIEFDEEEPARRFEKYLKTGSGREFSRRHFRQTVTTKRRPFADSPES
ncbi:MAG: GIY-YIG nuclease family protein [Vicinamibacterales bacterium]